MDRHDTALLDLILRIAAVIIVVARAKSRNRTPWLWGIFSLILPIPCLIIIWFVKHKKLTVKTPPLTGSTSTKPTAHTTIAPAAIADKPVLSRLSEVDRINHKLALSKLSNPLTSSTVILGDVLMPRREYEDLVISLGPGGIEEERASINTLVRAIFPDRSKGLRVFNSEDEYHRFITSYFPSYPVDARNKWFRTVAIPLSYSVTESDAVRFLESQSVTYSTQLKPTGDNGIVATTPPVVKTPLSLNNVSAVALPAKKVNWLEFQKLLQQHNITKLYHFTDKANIISIRQSGGLLSWYSCQQKGIEIPRPGGSQLSWNLDSGKGLADYVRLSFTPDHPMMHVARGDGRISSPIILEIDPQVIFWEATKFSAMNAAKNGVQATGSLEALSAINFSLFKRRYFDLSPDDKSRFQAEILVHQMLPAEYILNLAQITL